MPELAWLKPRCYPMAPFDASERADLELILYHTSQCHLCELAEALCLELIQNDETMTIRTVDIVTDDQLMARYGWLIPVVAHGDFELNWPFDDARLREWVAQLPTRTASTSHEAP